MKSRRKRLQWSFSSCYYCSTGEGESAVAQQTAIKYASKPRWDTIRKRHPLRQKRLHRQRYIERSIHRCLRSPAAPAAAVAVAAAVDWPPEAPPLRPLNALPRPEATCMPFAGTKVDPVFPAAPSGSAALSLASILGGDATTTTTTKHKRERGGGVFNGGGLVGQKFREHRLVTVHM